VIRLLRRRFGRVDAEDVAGRSVQPDKAEIGGLVNAVLVVEEEAHAIGGVIPLGLHLVLGDEFDLGIGVLEQGDELLGHRAGQFAAMLCEKLHCIGKPPHRVAQRADRELDQHLAALGRVFVRHDALARLPQFEAVPHEILLCAADPAGRDLGLVEDVAGIQIGDPHAPRLAGFRQHDAAAFVEIVPGAVWALLRRHRGGRHISRPPLRLPRCRCSWRRRGGGGGRRGRGFRRMPIHSRGGVLSVDGGGGGFRLRCRRNCRRMRVDSRFSSRF